MTDDVDCVGDWEFVCIGGIGDNFGLDKRTTEFDLRTEEIGGGGGGGGGIGIEATGCSEYGFMLTWNRRLITFERKWWGNVYCRN